MHPKRKMENKSMNKLTTIIKIQGLKDVDPKLFNPFLIFPRVHFRDHFLLGGVEGSAGDANSSGWMTSTIFLKFMEHFVKFAKPTENEPVLLLVDNHESHLSLECLKFARENHIVMLSFPPHTTHKLQPLDISVYGSLKTNYNTALTTYMNTTKAGQVLTIYDVPVVLKLVYSSTFSDNNIRSGFSATGIWPVNRHVFSDDDFAANYVLDRPEQSESEKEDDPAAVVNENDNALNSSDPVSSVLIPLHTSTPMHSNSNVPELRSAVPIPSSKHSSDPTPPSASARSGDSLPSSERSSDPIPSTSLGMTNNTSFYDIRPLPKINKKRKATKRRMKKSTVLTDSPYVQEAKQKRLEKENKENAKAKKQLKFEPKRKKKNNKKIKGTKTQKKPQKKQPELLVSDDNSDDDQEYICIICNEKYGTGRRETWIQCGKCTLWAHEVCTDYIRGGWICDACNYESSEDFSSSDHD